MKIAIYTLGCKVNQYETQAMETILRQRGHELVEFEEPADAYIVNTCTVTAVSDKKSRQMIRRARRRSPDAVVAVCGCYAQTSPEQLPDRQLLGLFMDLLNGRRHRDADVHHRTQTGDQNTGIEQLPHVQPDGVGQLHLLPLPCPAGQHGAHLLGAVEGGIVGIVAQNSRHSGLCKVVVCAGLDLRPGYAKASDDDPRKDHHRKQGAEHTLEHLLPLIQISFPSYLNGRM